MRNKRADKCKIPSEGPLLAANTQKVMNSGISQRKAISMAGLRGSNAKGVDFK